MRSKLETRSCNQRSGPHFNVRIAGTQVIPNYKLKRDTAPRTDANALEITRTVELNSDSRETLPIMSLGGLSRSFLRDDVASFGSSCLVRVTASLTVRIIPNAQLTLLLSLHYALGRSTRSGTDDIIESGVAYFDDSTSPFDI